jgi:hypothetical protein
MAFLGIAKTIVEMNDFVLLYKEENINFISPESTALIEARCFLAF